MAMRVIYDNAVGGDDDIAASDGVEEAPSGERRANDGCTTNNDS